MVVLATALLMLMFRIINNLDFNTPPIVGDRVALQIAELLNKYNNLSLIHSSFSIKNDKGYYLVYMDGGRVIGCTAVRKEEPMLTRNYHTSVMNNYRGKGIGSLLIEEALKIVKTQFLFCTVRKDNHQSIALYNKYKFVYVRDENKNLILMGRRNWTT